jgi:hypothetical protein
MTVINTVTFNNMATIAAVKKFYIIRSRYSKSMMGFDNPIEQYTIGTNGGKQLS